MISIFIILYYIYSTVLVIYTTVWLHLCIHAFNWNRIVILILINMILAGSFTDYVAVIADGYDSQCHSVQNNINSAELQDVDLELRLFQVVTHSSLTMASEIWELTVASRLTLILCISTDAVMSRNPPQRNLIIMHYSHMVTCNTFTMLC